MMKDLLLRNLLTVAFLLLLPLSAKATGWSAEVIRVNGQKWELLEKPLNNDSIGVHPQGTFLEYSES